MINGMTAQLMICVSKMDAYDEYCAANMGGVYIQSCSKCRQ